MNSNNDNNNFNVFSGIRSFARLDGGYIIVKDVETKYSSVEDIKHVYDVLQLLLTKERFVFLERELVDGNEVVYNFITDKLSFVRQKEDKKMNSFFLKEMQINVIEKRQNDPEENEKYFLK